jgi:hypothetical protein
MDLEEYRRQYGGKDDAAPGWDAIDARLREVYGEQEPKHWGTIIKHMFGGKDPLDGISAYQSTKGGDDHLHFCTYGYSSLYYDEESVGAEFSRFGFEMTFRLLSPLPPAEEPIWVCNLLENLARYVFSTQNWFENNQWLDARGPLKLESGTKLVGLAFAYDPELPAIDSPHGRVEFLQAFGITGDELESLKNESLSCENLLEQHRQVNPFLITDLSRVP